MIEDLTALESGAIALHRFSFNLTFRTVFAKIIVG